MNGQALDLFGPGRYTLETQTEGGESEVISEGTYTFDGQIMECRAERGSSLAPVYDADRNVIEGTAVPVNGNDDGNVTAVTLEKQ